VPLLSTTRRAAVLSPPLPVPHSLFAGNGLSFRRGQFSLMASAPGVGKSVFATNLSIRTRVPVLFFSADSDEWTVRTRACAILSGTQLDDIEKNLNDEAWEAFYADKLAAANHIDWCYQSDIDLEFLVLRLQAHAELRGDYPHLIVVDNLGNTVADQDNEYAELRGTCRELQRIARSTNAHILALHHVKGAKENGVQPIGLGDLLGNIGKISEVVLGMNRLPGDPNAVNISVAKNRGGKSQQQIRMPLDYATATLGGFE
jgi:hypothetical protein